MQSLCGEKYGCINGEVFSCYGEIVRCGLCLDVAVALTTIICQEEIEFVSCLGESGEWVRKSQVADRLNELLLTQALGLRF